MNQNQNNEGKKRKDGYSFIKETRKKKPADAKTWLRRILVTAAFAAGAGILAGLMFVLSVPVFQGMLAGRISEPEKIEMASVATSSELPDEEEELKEEEKTEEPLKEVPLTAEEERAEAIRQYKLIYKGMMEQAKTAERFVVDVVSITSTLDYFNQNYENQQQVSGILVAQTESKIFCLTENRGLKKAEEIRVIFCDNSTAKAEYQCSDSETGLAIVTISRGELSDETWKTISLAELGNSNALRQGDPIIAIGSVMGIGSSVEYGILTSMKNQVSLWDASYNLFTTDMVGSITGSGVLLNLNGEVVGIINQNFSSENQNMITAIPIKQLEDLMQILINNEKQIRVGIKGMTVTTDISESTGIPRGILVSAVDQESPAMYAGIKECDVIVGIAGQEIENFAQYERVIAELNPETEITVQAMRMGKENYEEISFDLKPETK